MPITSASAQSGQCEELLCQLWPMGARSDYGRNAHGLLGSLA